MDTILGGGGGYCVGAETFVEASGQKIVWFTRDQDGQMLLNIDLRDAAGEPLFTMTDNDWIVAGDVDDLEVPPKGRSLTCKALHDGVNLTLSMQEVSEDELQDLVREHSRSFDDDWAAVKQTVKTFPALLIELKAKLVWPASVSIGSSKITVGDVSFPAPLTIGSQVAFSC
jgi:hypothetical protein